MEQDILRERIFARVETWKDECGGFFTYQQLLNFEIDGRRVALAGQRGIINPQIFDATLTVTSDPKSKYGDHFDDNGILRYAFQDGDPLAGANRKLLVALETKTPIILFEKPLPNCYVPHVGAFVVNADFESQFVEIAADALSKAEIDPGISEIERKYRLAQTRRRVHQPAFRAIVMNAYKKQCAICRLQHVELLDAAHIISDGEVGGTATVPNGLALCKIHHAAFDSHLLGIDPDYKVHINERLLEEIDGPMLEHGLKEMHLTEITTPTQKSLKPDRDKLAHKFELFMAS